MRILLDTHALLWTVGNPAELNSEARDTIEDGANVVLVSIASAWEIAIKRGSGKLEAPRDLGRAIADQSFATLGITLDHARAVGDLPAHHRDPFDRMLIAQALVEGLTIVTRDPRFAIYGVPLLAA